MTKYSGASFLFWAKRREERFVLLNNNDTLGICKGILKEETSDLDEVRQKLLPPELIECKTISIKEVPNYHFIKTKSTYIPCILMEITYSDLYLLLHTYGYCSVQINELFPYLYESTPGEESYKDTDFYKKLYNSDQPYKGIDATVARTIFQNWMRISYVS